MRNPPTISMRVLAYWGCPSTVMSHVAVSQSSWAVCAVVRVYVKWPVAVRVAALLTMTVPSSRVMVTVAVAGDGSVATPSWVICRSMVVLVFCWTRCTGGSDLHGGHRH
jgi:hypothetical protein